MKNFETRLLLSKNPKALQFLHHAAGFDFEAPHPVSRICGRVTARTVAAQVPAGHVAALLIERTPDRYHRAGYTDLVYVRFTGSKFDAGQMRGVCYLDYHIDYLFSVGDFETMRKTGTANAWIVTQAPEHMRNHSRFTAFGQWAPIDAAARYAVHGHTRTGNGHGAAWVGSVNVSRIGHNEKPTEYRPGGFPAAVLDVVDASGYLVCIARENLRNRAKARRAEKLRNAAAAHDFSAERAAVAEALETARAGIVAKIANAENAAELKTAAEALRNLATGAGYLEHFDAGRGRFSSVENGRRWLNLAAEYIQKGGAENV